MLWGCVAGNLVQVEGRMDSTQYQQILGNNVQNSVGENAGVGCFCSTAIQSIDQNLPRNSCRGTDTMC